MNKHVVFTGVSSVTVQTCIVLLSGLIYVSKHREAECMQAEGMRRFKKLTYLLGHFVVEVSNTTLVPLMSVRLKV